MRCILLSFFSWFWKVISDHIFRKIANHHRRRAFCVLGRGAIIAGLLAVSALHTAGTALAEGPASKPSAIPMRLIIPAIAVDSEIETVGSHIVDINGRKYRQWDTSDNLVGWHNRSAPLGHRGNTVLAGHSDIFSMVFQNLGQLEPGQTVYVATGETIHRYIITEVLEVQEAGVSLAQRVANGRLISTTDDERLTLITCSRPGSTHRMVVVAHPAGMLPIVHHQSELTAPHTADVATETEPVLTHINRPAAGRAPSSWPVFRLPMPSDQGLWLKNLVY